MVRSILEKLGLLKKKPEPTPKPEPEPKPSRIAVHASDGNTYVHYAVYRTRTPEGGLMLHDKKGGGYLVAEYAPGAWLSFSHGKRKRQPKKAALVAKVAA